MIRAMIIADAVGGVWQYATDLAAALPCHGVQPTLVVNGPAPGEAQRAAAAGVEMIETGLALDWIAADPSVVRHAGARLAALAYKLRVDVVQLNAPAYAADVTFPCPVVAVAHSCVATWWAAVEDGELPRDLAWRGEQTRAGLRAADAVLAPSHAFAAATRATHGVAVQAVHNGRRALPVRPAAVHDYAMTAGRLWDRGKNVRVLDRAAARLGVPFYAAGATEGPHGERMEFNTLVPLGSLGVTALADRLGPKPVFASAARYEPFGLAVLEAAQAGCPLVLSDIPTFRELWADAALFVPTDDDAAFADAINALIGDEAARAAAGAAASARAARYSVGAMAAATASVLKGAVGVERLAA